MLILLDMVSGLGEWSVQAKFLADRLNGFDLADITIAYKNEIIKRVFLDFLHGSQVVLNTMQD